MDLFCNAEIILTKNNIIQKTIELLDEVQQQMVKGKFEHEIFSVSPKISKGENYLGLPYVTLDYPRKAENESIFFIRSMFWWGNFFSSTLHISGRFKEQYSNKLEGAYDELKRKDFFIGINDDPWMHHFEENNYQMVSGTKKFEFDMLLDEQQHIKLAAKWPLTEWDNASTLLFDSWKFLVSLIA